MGLPVGLFVALCRPTWIAICYLVWITCFDFVFVKICCNSLLAALCLFGCNCWWVLLFQPRFVVFLESVFVLICCSLCLGWCSRVAVLLVVAG